MLPDAPNAGPMPSPRGVPLLRTVLPVAEVGVAVLTLVAAVWMLRYIIRIEAGEDRFSEMGKAVFWLVGLIAPAVGYHFLRRSADRQAGLILAIALVHVLLSCAAIGMWWGVYSGMARAILIAWGLCG